MKTNEEEFSTTSAPDSIKLAVPETLWVNNDGGPAIEIPTKRCRNVGDLIDVTIKKINLQSSPRDFRLYADRGRIPLGSLKPLEHVVREFDVSKEYPLKAVKKLFIGKQ